MNVKRYLAKDEQEAMQKIRYELGRDAVILHTRKIRQKGIKGWFAKPLVEVVAAIDTSERQMSSKSSNKGANVQYQANHVSAHSDYLREATQALLMERAKELEKSRELEQDKAKPNIVDDIEKVNFQSELEVIKRQISALAEMMKTFSNANLVKEVDPTETPESTISNQINGYNSLTNESDLLAKNETTVEQKQIQDLKAQLFKQRISENGIEKILAIVKRQAMTEQTSQGFLNVTKTVIRELIGMPYRIERKDVGPQVYFFVGPTGVGKTTTLAKIAAKLSLIEGKKIGLITSDTYRISAVDQLKTYSEILNVPLEVIYEADEIDSVLNKYSDKDFVLVDTAGRNHKSPELKADLSELLKHTSGAEVFLVISLTTSPDDIESIIASYDFIEKYELILTKLDEAASYGSIFNTKLSTNQPIAFITNGQSVPDDIIIADPEKIAALLLGD